MATNFYNRVAHGVAESSALLGTEGGSHVLNFKAPADLDNGSFVSLSSFDAGDVWNCTYPDADKAVFLILSSPLIYEESERWMQEESNFYNKAADIVRGYHLAQFDRFALSDEAFAANATPAVGSYLTFPASSYKAGVTTTKPQSGFCARVYDQASNGLWRIIVEEV